MSALVSRADPHRVGEAGWKIEVDGKRVKAGHVVIENDRFGTFSFGRRPEGTIGWGWREKSGVGIVPYVVFGGQKLMIGVVCESRPFIEDGRALNIPRGFPIPGKTDEESALTELREEMGLEEERWRSRLESLDGSLANVNSTFFDTTNGEGFHYFSLRVERSEFDVGSLTFRKDLVLPLRLGAGETIFHSIFLRWDRVAALPDNYSSAGVARLLAAKPELAKYL